MMKKTNLNKVLVFMLFFLVLANSAFAEVNYISGRPSIRILKVRQDPDLAVPGEIVEILLQVENLGSEIAENVELSVVPDYPLSIYGDSSIKQVGDLSAFQEDEQGVQVRFKLLVSEGASDEVIDLDLRFTYDNGDSSEWHMGTSVEIIIDNPLTGFEVTGSQVSEDISEIYVVNSGKNTASSILMFVNEERAYSIGDLSSGELATKYVSLPDGFSTNDLLSIEFQYTDSASIRRSSTSFAKIYPIEASDVEVLVRDISGSTVTVVVVNAGNFPLYAVSVKPLMGSVIQSIIGNLDAGDYSLATFTLPNLTQPSFERPDGTESVVKPVTSEVAFEVSYTDTLGERRKSLENVDLINSEQKIGVPSGMIKQKPSSLNSSYLWFGVIGVLGIVGGLYFFNKKRALKKNKKK